MATLGALLLLQHRVGLLPNTMAVLSRQLDLPTGI